MLKEIRRIWAEADAEARKPIVVGETIHVVFKNPPMESVTEYLARTEAVNAELHRDRFFAVLNRNKEQRTGDETV